jgi:hypothetical protein
MGALINPTVELLRDRLVSALAPRRIILLLWLPRSSVTAVKLSAAAPSAWSPRLQPWRAPRLKPWTPGRRDAVGECALT